MEMRSFRNLNAEEETRFSVSKIFSRGIGFRHDAAQRVFERFKDLFVVSRREFAVCDEQFDQIKKNFHSAEVLRGDLPVKIIVADPRRSAAIFQVAFAKIDVDQIAEKLEEKLDERRQFVSFVDDRVLLTKKIRNETRPRTLIKGQFVVFVLAVPNEKQLQKIRHEQNDERRVELHSPVLFAEENLFDQHVFQFLQPFDSHRRRVDRFA